MIGREKDILRDFTLDQMVSTSTMAIGRRQRGVETKTKKQYLRLKIVQGGEPLADKTLRKEEFEHDFRILEGLLVEQIC